MSVLLIRFPFTDIIYNKRRWNINARVRRFANEQHYCLFGRYNIIIYIHVGISFDLINRLQTGAGRVSNDRAKWRAHGLGPREDVVRGPRTRSRRTRSIFTIIFAQNNIIIYIGDGHYFIIMNIYYYTCLPVGLQRNVHSSSHRRRWQSYVKLLRFVCRVRFKRH